MIYRVKIKVEHNILIFLIKKLTNYNVHISEFIPTKNIKNGQ